MRLSARPPSSYARTTVLVLVLSMISGTSIQAASTTVLPDPVPAPIVSPTRTTTTPKLITTSTTTTTIPPGIIMSTTSTTITTTTPTTTTTTTPTTTMTATSTTTTTPTTTTIIAPPQTITSTTIVPKPTTTTTTAPPDSVTITNAATTNFAASTPMTPDTAPSTATTTVPSTVSTSTVPPNPTASNNDFSLLWKCSPLGSDQCSFSTQSNVGLQSYNLILGTPVSNCLNSTTAIDSQISGSISTSDTWSPGLSVGLQFGPLSLSGSAGWTRTTTRTYSQSITIHVPPAQQGALIAIVEYNVSSGHMKVSSTDVYPVFSNQPTGNIKYDAAVIGCDATFNANYSAPLPISGSRLHRPMSSSMLFMSAILVGMTYML